MGLSATFYLFDMIFNEILGKVYQKECPKFEQAWGMKSYTYKIPKKSFCSDYCGFIGSSDPYWFDCDKGIMPTIEFFFSRSKSCNVLSSKGVDDEDNQDCINKVSSLLNKHDNQKSKIVYITHGYTSDGSIQWIKTMKDSLLSRYGIDKTVVAIVDWKRGASRSLISTINKVSGIDLRDKSQQCCMGSIVSNYGKAAVNTWPIGNILAYVNEKVMKKVNSKNVKVACVGHSLGSHLCGFFGKMSERIDQTLTLTKIVGLDPAGPIWDYNDTQLKQDPSLRLNKEDALNVEVFHTNAEILGYRYPIGDIDFYINGGYRQPQCASNDTFGVCSHGLSIKLFNAINKNSKKRTKSGQCDAKWKCNSSIFQSAYPEIEDLQDLEDCCNIGREVTLGDLDNNNKGTYWIQAGEDSDTCYFDSKSGIFLLTGKSCYYYFFFKPLK